MGFQDPRGISLVRSIFINSVNLYLFYLKRALKLAVDHARFTKISAFIEVSRQNMVK